jgi:poly(ADP-ribose) glycohydrolase ARH3
MALPDLEDRFVGSMLGLALGDALGAPHEGGPVERLAWRLICLPYGRLLRWTDDTQMSMALAESLLARNGFDRGHAAGLWADRAEFLRGYGPGTRKILARIRAGEDPGEAAKRVFPQGSFGNGAAMRVVPLALFYGDASALEDAARRSAEVTHAHPLGVEGAVLMARAAALALGADVAPNIFLETLLAGAWAEEYRSRLRQAIAWIGQEPTASEVRRILGNGVRAHESVVTALHCFCRFNDEFPALADFVVSLGGDTDTVLSMAGGLFGAKNGERALPQGPLSRLESREEIAQLARKLYAGRA